jgi:hypothetical protein
MVVNSAISFAVSGKQYVMVFTGEGQSVTAGPLGLTKDGMPPAVRRHNSIFAFALPWSKPCPGGPLELGRKEEEEER